MSLLSAGQRNAYSKWRKIRRACGLFLILYGGRNPRKKTKKCFLASCFLYKLIKIGRFGGFVALLVLPNWSSMAFWSHKIGKNGLSVLFSGRELPTSCFRLSTKKLSLPRSNLRRDIFTR